MVVVAKMSGMGQNRPVQRPRLSLTFCGERFATLQTVIFALILPVPSRYGVRHCLTVVSEHIGCSNATFSNKTLTLFTVKFAFRILLCV